MIKGNSLSNSAQFLELEVFGPKLLVFVAQLDFFNFDLLLDFGVLVLQPLHHQLHLGLFCFASLLYRSQLALQLLQAFGLVRVGFFFSSKRYWALLGLLDEDADVPDALLHVVLELVVLFDLLIEHSLLLADFAKVSLCLSALLLYLVEAFLHLVLFVELPNSFVMVGAHFYQLLELVLQGLVLLPFCLDFVLQLPHNLVVNRSVELPPQKLYLALYLLGPVLSRF